MVVELRDGFGQPMPNEQLMFELTRGNGQVWMQWNPATPTTPRVEQYPGAESYGPYLRVETDSVPSASLMTALCTRPWYSENYLRNGGFEKGMMGWSPRGGDDMPNHKIETEGVAEGKQCASVEKSGYYYCDKLGLPVGTVITATAKIRTTPLPAGQGATMTIHFWKAGKAFDSKHVGPFADADWTEHEFTATVPEGTEQVSLALEFFAPGKAWFDNVSL